MTQDTNQLYNRYTELAARAADLNNAAAVLGWDQEVYMPPQGAVSRARQLSTLAAAAHEILTGAEFGNVLQQLASSGSLTEDQRSNVSLSLDDYEKNSKLTPAFVEALSRQTSECFNAWIDARKQNDLGIFLPSLTKMIGLKRQQSDLYGFDKHPYDPHLDDYEKGATVAMLDPIFENIRQQLPPLLSRIEQARQVENSCLHQFFPKGLQWDFSLEVLRRMGFDFDAGRQDYSEHPFTTSFGPGDVRLTTRVDEHNFATLLWSCIHEGGHGLYEQGLPAAEYGLPLGSAASLGIHESQSRLWENCIGRGKLFWQYMYPRLAAAFPQQLGSVSADTFWKAMNRVEPSLIRTEADELTYHFHVMIRYEIEKLLLDGTLAPAGIRGAWSDLYHQYLGITPQDDRSGVLQDVHWSHGSFGYFPTYTLGSFYAAQFFHRAQSDIPAFQEQIAHGDFSALLTWLRTNIHRHGRRHAPAHLCELVTGSKPDAAYFMNYAREKFASIYEFEPTTVS